ncbi:hypothetical protein PR048_001679 [Dryococelus australis]|uniref:Uncharacterized protein n=1 Tax=Dryococelus australis TaxID=614101 RepID=A0ABQ9IJG8_9NEOP|nr:hypothetical protein PR048_001679 [Dryococelus australis]
MEKNKINYFFMAVSCLFDPTVAGQMLNLNLSSLEECKEKIPFFANRFHAHLVTNIRSSYDVDCLQIMLALKLQHHKFSDSALKCLWTPTNSVDAERFLSKYNIIVTDCRNRMKEETVEICSMLSFNAAISVE